MIKILDCTLRDGGYYTNWDFDKNIVDTYIHSMNQLPVDYLEIGYRSKPMKQYLGKYFYCPIYELQDLRVKSNKKLVIILNEKDVRKEDVNELLEPCVGLIDMVRIALDPENLKRAFLLAENIKKLGFEVGFNVMYMSKWKQHSGFINELIEVDSLADYFYMVDSYGGVYPEDVKATIQLIKEYTNCKIGFHGHNNLELALINSLTAIENGAEIIDATILGMGRGAGNLKTELLLTVLNSKFDLQVNFNAIGDVINSFDSLLEKHQWGTNLPYMISGANSLPQKNVMDWVTARYYSFNSIIRALQNQKNNIKDNEQLPVFSPKTKFSQVLIVGGGPNGVEHSQAINEFIKNNEDVCVLHASSKNAFQYKELSVKQFFCLVGNEGHRLEKVFDDLGGFKGECVLPPFPRKMGTYIPASIYNSCFQLDKIEFTDKLIDSHCALALQTAFDLGAKRIFIVGFDGYQENSINQLERTLLDENEYLFGTFQQHYDVQILSLTPTKYKTIATSSVYSLI